MLSLIVSLFAIFSISLALSTVFKCEFSKMIILSQLILIILMYVLALIGVLGVAKYVVLLICATSLAICVINNKRIKASISDASVLIWLIFLFVTIYMNYGRLYTFADEFSHWGTAVKEMFYSHQIYSSDMSPIVYKEYPPASSLIELFYNLFEVEYNEGLTYIAYYTFLFSLLFHVFSYVEKNYKLIVKVLLAIFLFFFMALWGSDSYYGTILADQMMAYLTAVLIFIYFVEDDNKIKITYLLLGIFVLTLIKPSSIALSLLLVCIIAIDLVIEKKANKKNLIWLASICLMCGISKLSWQINLMINQVQMEYSDFSNKGFGAFINRLFSGELTGDEKKVIFDIVYRFFVPVPKDFPWGISPFLWLLFILLLLFITKGIKEKRLRILYYVLVAFLVVWCMGTALTDIIVFPSNEGVSAYYRYIPSIVVMITVAFLLISVIRLKQRDVIIISVVGIILAIFIVPDRIQNVFTPKDRIEKEIDFRNGYGIPQIYSGLIEGDKVLVVYQHEKYPLSGAGVAGLIYYYYFVPQNIKKESDPLWNADFSPKDEKSINDKLINSKPDYIYFWKVDEKYMEYYSNVFKCDVVSNTYYKVTYSDDFNQHATVEKIDK